MLLSFASTSNCIQLQFGDKTRCHGVRCGTPLARSFIHPRQRSRPPAEATSCADLQLEDNQREALPHFSLRVGCPLNGTERIRSCAVIEVVQPAQAAAPTCRPGFDNHPRAWRQTWTQGSSAGGSNFSSRLPRTLAIGPWLKPNPSFEATPNGKACWPRSAHVHSTPRGQHASPPGSPQLER